MRWQRCQFLTSYDPLDKNSLINIKLIEFRWIRYQGMHMRWNLRHVILVFGQMLLYSYCKFGIQVSLYMMNGNLNYNEIQRTTIATGSWVSGGFKWTTFHILLRKISWHNQWTNEWDLIAFPTSLVVICFVICCIIVFISWIKHHSE